MDEEYRNTLLSCTQMFLMFSLASIFQVQNFCIQLSGCMMVVYYLVIYWYIFCSERISHRVFNIQAIIFTVFSGIVGHWTVMKTDVSPTDYIFFVGIFLTFAFHCNSMATHYENGRQQDERDRMNAVRGRARERRNM
ncbi:hypothetical protein CRE_01131 [Caenorhabditis remanei]|uniref:Uncharacterized protein n=1 Tax=Caenorhabditis remanei TaxID=31234 RepID=E3MWL5_CAERE|nr:hypothetical protein CRE_01131 [Caenorhabditis remanei]